MRTSKFSVSKQLPITSVVSPSTQLAVIEHLERRSGLLSAAEACRILGTHRKTLYERLRSGDLQGIKDHGKLKLDPRNLAEYIRKREQSGTPTQRYRKTKSESKKAPAANDQGSIKRLEPCSTVEELQKYGLTLESLSVTIPRVIVNCVLRKAEMSEKHDISSLTAAERLVYSQLRNPKRDQEIADEMKISVRTVRFHIGNIFRKLRLSSRQEILSTNHHL